MARIVSEPNFIQGIFLCDCSSLDHSMQMMYFEKNPKVPDDDEDFYLSFSMMSFRKFFARVWVAAAFILFKKLPKDGFFQPISFCESESSEMSRILSMFAKDSPDNSEKLLLDEGVFEALIQYVRFNFSEGDWKANISATLGFSRKLNIFSRIRWMLHYVLRAGRYYVNTSCFTLTREEAAHFKRLVDLVRDVKE